MMTKNVSVSLILLITLWVYQAINQLASYSPLWAVFTSHSFLVSVQLAFAAATLT